MKKEEFLKWVKEQRKHIKEFREKIRKHKESKQVKSDAE